ncbi:TAXI family TRAP transporter solute-binding subunit [Falsirhodobacter halotolerans]|uniref:TAXI family TRAP transporter solute-binding subunit n=1 Tax=Falsirhodobacter halotolerans TaxID=1146892 RepID=UPI001FD0BDE4|nr:TAXI family TRAP transporter solute-binding subunit [Falsirhodobacter halotolerans]MCJ8140051.1 TAXI family TRAP transporter solute-binding subunit [Falsirhodobacter halotolerans]
MTARRTFSLAAATLLTAVPATALRAQEVVLPKTLAVTSYDVGAASYNQAVALGTALGNAYDTSLRVLPATSDVARLIPVRQGRVQFGIVGSESFNAAEGTEAFSAPEIGPQPLRMLVGSNSDNCFTMALRGDAGIESVADLRGKRVASVVGAPALQSNVAGFLAFGGLSWEDVVPVEVASFGASWEALINDQVDAITTITTTGLAQQAASSPSGLKWLPLPAWDTEGWARLQAIKPQFSPRNGTLGPNLSVEHPVACAGFPFPVVVAYPEQDADLAYNLTKAINEQFDNYVKIEPAMVGWAPDRQDFQWVLPYHEGAIRYWKEVGLWTDEAQANNDMLVQRQDLLSSVWDEVADVPALEKTARWLDMRRDALQDAGLPVYE